ncbi:MAG: metallophosphoesterase family protein [Solirubrobacteraceae bacterium]|nr:metallophosphoesterase family protein [Solirubrobacteraceae bacterium]
MRVAVLSDVHGNLEALQATLSAIDVAAVDDVWSLGDVVGYGARPAACMALLRDRCSVKLAGNHDLVAAGESTAEGFSRSARIAISWTARQLSPEERAEIREWPSSTHEFGYGLAHGSMRDPAWEYVVEPTVARACLEDQIHQVVLVGHSHLALSWQLDETVAGGAAGVLRTDGDRIDLGERNWILNPGSVGQPRDRDPRAAWLELDLTERTAQWHRVEYDVVTAQAAIRNAGLPDALADRLGAGL